jgi:hypothetical protein
LKSGKGLRALDTVGKIKELFAAGLNDGLFGKTESIRVFPQVFDRSINDPTKLIFQIINRPAVIRQHDPAHLDGLTHTSIDLSGSKHCPQVFRRVRIILIEYRHFGDFND